VKNIIIIARFSEFCSPSFPNLGVGGGNAGTVAGVTWLTKGAVWTRLVNDYGLFKDGRLRQIRQAEPSEALQLLGSVAADLVQYLGVGR
jgi:LmbE family N-acetylglucosaminyl deacetylase